MFKRQVERKERPGGQKHCVIQELHCCQQRESKRPGQLLSTILTNWLATPLKRI